MSLTYEKKKKVPGYIKTAFHYTLRNFNTKFQGLPLNFDWIIGLQTFKPPLGWASSYNGLVIEQRSPWQRGPRAPTGGGEPEARLYAIRDIWAILQGKIHGTLGSKFRFWIRKPFICFNKNNRIVFPDLSQNCR